MEGSIIVLAFHDVDFQAGNRLQIGVQSLRHVTAFKLLVVKKGAYPLHLSYLRHFRVGSQERLHLRHEGATCLPRRSLLEALVGGIDDEFDS